MQTTKIPATVITGFLGAGKTTLIQNLLRNADGKRIALIVNEFGDLGVDGGILSGCGIEGCNDDDMIELNNGCICCTVADDFLPAMEKLLDRANPPDHIVIETSGLALPQPLVNAFNWPEVKTRVTVDGVVTVVDSEAVAAGRFAHDHGAVDRQRAADESLDHDTPLEDLFEDQLSAADLVILTKADLVGPDVLDQVRHDIAARIERPLPFVAASHGNVPLDVLLGLDAATESSIAARPARHHDHAHHHHHDDDDDHDHDHDRDDNHHHDDHGHDAFASFVVTRHPVGDIETFKAALSGVLRDQNVLRCKGFAAVEGKPMRLVVQAVGGRIDTYFDRPFQADEARATRFVVIGQADMDKAAIEQAIAAISA